MLNDDLIIKSKILITDDESEIVDLIENILRKENFKNIKKCYSGKSCIKITKEFEPDILILDIMLPDIDGFEVCKKIRTFSYSHIIFLSAKTEEIDKMLALGYGGDDYVTKPFSPMELVFRIKAHLRRNKHYNKNDTKSIKIITKNLLIDEKLSQVKKNNKIINMTATEYKIILFLAKHPNQILSKQQLCNEIWDENYSGIDNSIMVHIRHIREKIETDPKNPEFIITHKGLGYKFVLNETGSE
jgi:DNA-binding response OmpR family regulator